MQHQPSDNLIQWFHLDVEQLGGTAWFDPCSTPYFRVQGDEQQFHNTTSCPTGKIRSIATWFHPILGQTDNLEEYHD